MRTLFDRFDSLRYALFVIISVMPLMLMGQTTIIPPTYEKVRGFSDGLAAVCKNGKWGYINLRGNVVITPQYQEVGDFHEDMAAVCVDNRWGFIDKSNTFVISPKYCAAHHFSCGLAAVAIAPVSSSGEDVVSYYGANEDNWIYIDKNGNMPFKNRFPYAYSFSNGYACVYSSLRKELYYIDKNGKNIFSTGTDIPFRYSDGILPKSDKETGFIGYSDINGIWVIEPQYSSASEFIDGLAVVGKFAEGPCVINIKGETIYSGKDPIILPNGYIFDNKKLYSKKDYINPCFVGDVKASINYYPYEVINNNLYGYNAIIYNQEHQKVRTLFQPSNGLLGAEFPNALYGFVTVDMIEYVTQYVSSQIDIWLKRGEFESTSAYENRTSNGNRQLKEVSLADDLINNWLKKGLDQWTLSNYDADNEAFTLTTDLGTYRIKIPVGSAKRLKDNWALVNKQVGFKYENGLSLAKIDFTFSQGSKDMTLSVNTATGTIQEVEHDIINKDLPSIKWLEFMATTTNKECPIKLGVNSKSKIENVSISVNGTQDRGVKTVNSSDYDLTINRTLTLNEGVNIIKLSIRNVAGTAQEEKTIFYHPQGGELPSIEWLDFAATANKREYRMKLGIKSKSKVEEVNVTMNGELTRGIKTVSSDGYDLTVDRTLSLSEGLNRIVVSVRNGDGISTSEKVITYQGNNPTPVFKDKRIAFVIGNSHYSKSEMNLSNPEHDATDVAEKLKRLGFEVMLKLDVTLEDMDKGLSAFCEKAKEYDVAMFYYAGHGIQSKGVNYLIPTNIDNLAEDNMKYKCVDMERVLDVMETSNCKLKIVVLDACRNDPLSRSWHRNVGTRGLSIMNAPTGTIISFSTAPGRTALDGKGRNSPYTEAFLNTLDMPNLDVFHFFQKVGAEVKGKTEQSQNPWWSSSFTGDFYFNKQ